MEQSMKSGIGWGLLRMRAIYITLGLWIFVSFAFLFLFSNGAGMNYVLNFSNQILSEKGANHPARYIPLVFALWTLSIPIVWWGSMLLYMKLWSLVTVRYSVR